MKNGNIWDLDQMVFGVSSNSDISIYDFCFSILNNINKYMYDLLEDAARLKEKLLALNLYLEKKGTI